MATTGFDTAAYPRLDPALFAQESLNRQVTIVEPDPGIDYLGGHTAVDADKLRFDGGDVKVEVRLMQPSGEEVAVHVPAAPGMVVDTGKAHSWYYITKNGNVRTFDPFGRIPRVVRKRREEAEAFQAGRETGHASQAKHPRLRRIFSAISSLFVQPMLTEEAPDYAEEVSPSPLASTVDPDPEQAPVEPRTEAAAQPAAGPLEPEPEMATEDRPQPVAGSGGAVHPKIGEIEVVYQVPDQLGTPPSSTPPTERPTTAPTLVEEPVAAAQPEVINPAQELRREALALVCAALGDAGVSMLNLRGYDTDEVRRAFATVNSRLRLTLERRASADQIRPKVRLLEALLELHSEYVKGVRP